MTDPAPSVDQDRLVVGLVRGVHGLRGAVRVEILTDNESRFDVGNVVHPEGSNDRLTITSSHRDGPGLLVRFAEVRDRPTADRLLDTYLEVKPGPAQDPTTFYWHDIVGCTVTTESGESLGTVQDVFRVGEAEVYEVRGPRGEVLIPAVASIVKELAPTEKRIVVDAGALGLNASDPAETAP